MIKHPIFIVGLHRSGSTLWHNLISMCPGVMRLTDPRFLSDGWHKDFSYFLKTQAGDLSVDQNVDRMVEMCFEKKALPGIDSTFWRFQNIEAADNPEFKKEVSCRIKQSDRCLGAIARIFLEEITRFSGYERPGVKFPVDIGHVPKLVEWFPGCRIMHITRDPRAVAMSKTNDPSGTALRILQHPRVAPLIRKAMVWLAIVQYRRTARFHLQYKCLPNYRLFRYEDLLAAPEQVLRDLCNFIEVEFNPEMLNPQKGRHEHQRSSITGKQQKAFDPAAGIRWESVMSPVDKSLVTRLTRRSMKMLEYDPDTHPIFSMTSHPCAEE